jgi:RNA polymerase sigma factor (sigma-70 family)
MSAGAGSSYARRTDGGRGRALSAPHRDPQLIPEIPPEVPEVEVPEAADVETLYRRYRASIYTYLARMTGDAEEAKDLTQEVFLRAHRRLPQGTTAIYPRAWLFQIATYTCLDHFRRKRSRVTTQAAPDDLREQCATDPYEQSQAAAAVSESLRRMPARHRAAIILKDIYGLKHAEIAAAMDISEGAAQVLLHRARGEFRDVFLGLRPVATGCPIAHRLATDMVGADLTLDQRRELREHARTCPECGQRLLARRTPAGALGFLLVPHAIPRGLAPDLPTLLGAHAGPVTRHAASIPWLEAGSGGALRAAETAARLAGPLPDWSVSLTSKACALLLAVALAGAGHIGAAGFTDRPTSGDPPYETSSGATPDTEQQTPPGDVSATDKGARDWTVADARSGSGGARSTSWAVDPGPDRPVWGPTGAPGDAHEVRPAEGAMRVDAEAPRGAGESSPATAAGPLGPEAPIPDSPRPPVAGGGISVEEGGPVGGGDAGVDGPPAPGTTGGGRPG